MKAGVVYPQIELGGDIGAETAIATLLLTSVEALVSRLVSNTDFR